MAVTVVRNTTTGPGGCCCGGDVPCCSTLPETMCVEVTAAGDVSCLGLGENPFVLTRVSEPGADTVVWEGRTDLGCKDCTSLFFRVECQLIGGTSNFLVNPTLAMESEPGVLCDGDINDEETVDKICPEYEGVTVVRTPRTFFECCDNDYHNEPITFTVIACPAARPFAAVVAVPSARRLPIVPCAHRSEEELGPAWAAANGLATARTWYECDLCLTKNPKNVPGVVCPCTGCGPKCDKYVPSHDDAD